MCVSWVASASLQAWKYTVQLNVWKKFLILLFILNFEIWTALRQTFCNCPSTLKKQMFHFQLNVLCLSDFYFLFYYSSTARFLGNYVYVQL